MVKRVHKLLALVTALASLWIYGLRASPDIHAVYLWVGALLTQSMAFHHRGHCINNALAARVFTTTTAGTPPCHCVRGSLSPGTADPWCPEL